MKKFGVIGLTIGMCATLIACGTPPPGEHTHQELHTHPALQTLTKKTTLQKASGNQIKLHNTYTHVCSMCFNAVNGNDGTAYVSLDGSIGLRDVFGGLPSNFGAIPSVAGKNVCTSIAAQSEFWVEIKGTFPDAGVRMHYSCVPISRYVQ